MKEFLDTMINKPFNSLSLKGEFKHEGKFVIIPDTIRRCMFLSPVEKEVIYELLSWAATSSVYIDGWCKVTEIQISNHTGLALSTVKKTVKSLSNRGFIKRIQDFDKRNKYKIIPIDENPWIVLSEIIFSIQEVGYRFYQNELYEQKEDFNELANNRRNWIESTMEFSKTPPVDRYIKDLTELIKMSSDQIDKEIKEKLLAIRSEIHGEIGIIFQKKYQ